MTTKMSYEVTVQGDTKGDLLIPIPPVLLEQLGWKPGDEVDIQLDTKGNYILSLVKK